MLLVSVAQARSRAFCALGRAILSRKSVGLCATEQRHETAPPRRHYLWLSCPVQTGQPLSDDVAARLRAGIGPTPPAPRIQGLPSPAPAAPAPAPTPAPAPAAAAPAPGASGAWPPLAADEAARINSLFSSVRSRPLNHSLFSRADKCHFSL